MRLPVKFYIPILALLVFVGIVAIGFHWRLSTDKSKTVEFIAAVVGGITAIYTLLLSVQQRRTAAAAAFMQRWNNPDFLEYRKLVRKSIDAKSVQGLDEVSVGIILSFGRKRRLLSCTMNLTRANEGVLLLAVPAFLRGCKARHRPETTPIYAADCVQGVRKALLEMVSKHNREALESGRTGIFPRAGVFSGIHSHVPSI